MAKSCLNVRTLPQPAWRRNLGRKLHSPAKGRGHRATAKRSESISSRAAVLGREKAPSSGGRGLRVHHAFLTFLPSKTIRGAAIWFRCQKGKAPPKRGEDYPGRKSR